MCVSLVSVDLFELSLGINDDKRLMIASLVLIRPICDDSSGAETICEGGSCAKVSD